MSTDERYEGWANRETWTVALHINNDQDWQESVHDLIRTQWLAGYISDDQAARAGRLVRLSAEEALSPVESAESTTGMFGRPLDGVFLARGSWLALQDIGSMWRVDWTEIGAAFLADVVEQDR